MNLPSGQEKRKNEELEERLGKLEGRHFRMLNRISNKLAQEKTYEDIRSAKQDIKSFMYNPQNHAELPLLTGVKSALYSKLDGSIKNTRFSNANLGLVVDNGDVKTNYDLQGLQNFMTHGKITNTDFEEMPAAFYGVKIENSEVLKYSENENANIAPLSTIFNSGIMEHSKNEFTNIAKRSLISNSRINNYSENNLGSIAEESRILTESVIGDYTNNKDTTFGLHSTYGRNDELNLRLANYSNNTIKDSEIQHNTKIGLINFGNKSKITYELPEIEPL